MARIDIAPVGSFGGGDRPVPGNTGNKYNKHPAPPSEPTKRRPVLFVHGLGSNCSDIAKDNLDAFLSAGYTADELYCTTYGPGVQANTADSMICEHPKRIRAFILFVLGFTGWNQLDLVSFSMGVPISRKAVLGGACVDDADVNLGDPITCKVHTFIGGAGPNQGALGLCPCVGPCTGPCNPITGISSYKSKFLDDINSNSNKTPHYESSGQLIAVFSKNDAQVGYTNPITGIVSSYIPFQDYYIQVDAYNHYQVLHCLGELDNQLLNRDQTAVQTDIDTSKCSPNLNPPLPVLNCKTTKPCSSSN